MEEGAHQRNSAEEGGGENIDPCAPGQKELHNVAPPGMGRRPSAVSQSPLPQSKARESMWIFRQQLGNARQIRVGPADKFADDGGGRGRILAMLELSGSHLAEDNPMQFAPVCQTKMQANPYVKKMIGSAPAPADYRTIIRVSECGRARPG